MALAQNASNLELHSHQRGGRHLEALTSRLNDVFEVPIHGSCSSAQFADLSSHFVRCHHFHTNKAFALPLDPQSHTRVTCDLCEYPILGIGRTSTQTTLASIETLAGGPQSRQGDVDVAPGQDQRVFSLSTPPPPLRVDTSQLSTITEGISPARQSPSPGTLPNSGVSTTADSTSHNEVSNNNQSRRDQKQEIATQEVARPSKAPRTNAAKKSSPTFRPKVSQQRLRDRLRKHLRKPRKFDVHRLGLHFHFEVSRKSSASGEPSPQPSDSEQVDVHEEDTAQLPAITDDPHVETGNAPEASIVDQSTPTPADTAASLQPPESGHPDPVGVNPHAQHEKYERIRMRRRELTLKRRAEMMSKCECPSECHCRHNSVRSDAASQGNESERSLHVPDHHLRNLLSESSGGSPGVNRLSQEQWKLNLLKQQEAGVAKAVELDANFCGATIYRRGSPRLTSSTAKSQYPRSSGGYRFRAPWPSKQED
ncbi:MAG: hypothetical protein Q9181_003146 [Wetmoreana brouardii]